MITIYSLKYQNGGELKFTGTGSQYQVERATKIFDTFLNTADKNCRRWLHECTDIADDVDISDEQRKDIECEIETMQALFLDVKDLMQKVAKSHASLLIKNQDALMGAIRMGILGHKVAIERMLKTEHFYSTCSRDGSRSQSKK